MRAGRLFGFWLPVVDGPSALEAVRMGGLPVLLVGGNVLLGAVLEAVRPDPSPLVVAGCAVVAVLLVAVAFRIRSGHAAWLPVVAILVVAWFVLRLLLAFAAWQAVAGLAILRVKVVTDLIVPVLCLVLLVGGLRGWWWLRRRAMRLSL